MLLERVVRTSAAVAASPGRLVKVAEIAALLREVAPDEIPAAVAFLSGELTQRQIGVGYAAIMDLFGPGGPWPPGDAAGKGTPVAGATTAGTPMASGPAAGRLPAGGPGGGRPAAGAPAGLPPPPGEPSLTLADADETFGAIGAQSGAGSQG